MELVQAAGEGSVNPDPARGKRPRGTFRARRVALMVAAAVAAMECGGLLAY